MSEHIFLTKEEVTELTGYKIPKLQCQWLKDRGWIFERNRNNRPIIGRTYAKSRLGGIDAEFAHAQEIRPNFSALASR